MLNSFAKKGRCRTAAPAESKHAARLCSRIQFGIHTARRTTAYVDAISRRSPQIAVEHGQMIGKNLAASARYTFRAGSPARDRAASSQTMF
jgi:hypothetical protein